MILTSLIGLTGFPSSSQGYENICYGRDIGERVKPIKHVMPRTCSPPRVFVGNRLFGTATRARA